MRPRRSKIAVLAASALTGVVVVSNAVAQVAGPPAQNLAALVGDSTAGAETGIFEITSMVVIAGAVVMTVAILMKAFGIGKKTINKV